jgi:hypothetical protein
MMQVSNNTYPSYSQTNTISKTEKSSETSFASMLTNNEKVEEKEETGRYLEYMDKFNYFDSLSAEDKKAFREILKDDQITMAEMDSLSYEQAVKFERYAYPQGNFTKEEIDNTPIVHSSSQIGAMLFSTKQTSDKTFNEALYRTSREINNYNELSTILGQVRMNVAQVYSGYELLPNFYVEAETKNQWDIDFNQNINFDQFLNDVISLHEREIKNPPNNDPQYILQHQKRLDGYNLISKHYYEIKNEAKYA